MIIRINATVCAAKNHDEYTGYKMVGSDQVRRLLEEAVTREDGN
jgi:hypothetical protein